MAHDPGKHHASGDWSATWESMLCAEQEMVVRGAGAGGGCSTLDAANWVTLLPATIAAAAMWMKQGELMC